MSGLVGKTALGTGWEVSSGFPNVSVTDAISALTVNLLLSRIGAVLLY
jgi:hypothetical protein